MKNPIHKAAQVALISNCQNHPDDYEYIFGELTGRVNFRKHHFVWMRNCLYCPSECWHLSGTNENVLTELAEMKRYLVNPFRNKVILKHSWWDDLYQERYTYLRKSRYYKNSTISTNNGIICCQWMRLVRSVPRNRTSQQNLLQQHCKSQLSLHH